MVLYETIPWVVRLLHITASPTAKSTALPTAALHEPQHPSACHPSMAGLGLGLWLGLALPPTDHHPAYFGLSIAQYWGVLHHCVFLHRWNHP